MWYVPTFTLLDIIVLFILYKIIMIKAEKDEKEANKKISEINYEMALKTYEYLMEQKEKGLFDGNPTKPDPSQYFLS